MDQITALLLSAAEERTKIAAASALAEKVGAMPKRQLESVLQEMRKEAGLVDGFKLLYKIPRAIYRTVRAGSYARAFKGGGGVPLQVAADAHPMIQRAATTGVGPKQGVWDYLDSLHKARFKAAKNMWNKSPGLFSGIKNVITQSNPEIGAAALTGLGGYGIYRGAKALLSPKPEDVGY